MNNIFTKLFFALFVVLGLILTQEVYSQATLFTEPFTSSLGQFTANGGSSADWVWKNACNYSASAGHSAPGSAMFVGNGLTCNFGWNYGSNVSGNMDSPTFFISGPGGSWPIIISFNYYIFNECGNYGGGCYYDRMYVYISTNSGTTWIQIADSYSGGLYNGGWRTYTRDITSYGPGPMRIRFSFNSLDGLYNNYDGIYVDDVKVTGPALTDQIIVNPVALAFSAEETGVVPAPQNINVTTVPPTLSWNTVVTQNPAPPNGFMSISPTSGTGSATVVTTILRTNLTPGTYNGNVRFYASTAMPKDVPITYEVIARVSIDPAVNPIKVKFGCKSTATIQKGVMINNLGGHFNGGVLEWQATTTDPAITILTPNGVEGQELKFILNPAGLTDGTWDKIITITGKNSMTGLPASNSPYSLVVRVEIEPMANVSQTKPVTAAYTPFTNPLGHYVAEVASNAGNINSFTVEMYPCQFPNGSARLRYVKRYFKESSSATTVNVNQKFYYTNTELMLGGVTNALLLKVWQQPVGGGAWFNRGGACDPNNNFVEALNLTSISGIFALAAPWTPKAMTFDLSSAIFDKVSRNTVLQWNTSLVPNDGGFMIERASGYNAEEAAWEAAGYVKQNTSEEYGFSEKISEEGTYLYRISMIDKDGAGYESNVFVVNAQFAPTAYALEQNYPNPFNPTTRISFSLPENTNVRLYILDPLGRVVAELVNGEMKAGRHSVEFAASNIPSGQYFYRIVAGSFSETKMMLITK